MKTAFGAECSFYYEDFNRGRDVRECRLLRAAGGKWSYRLCQRCPVPRWQQSNSCAHLAPSGRVTPGFLGFGRRMLVNAWCDRAAAEVAEPEVGCGKCHLDNPVLQALHQRGRCSPPDELPGADSQPAAPRAIIPPAQF